MIRLPRQFNGHLERYIFASNYCFKRKVIDLGSKDGYGSHIISRYAKSITQVDRHQKWLGWSDKYYQHMCPQEYVFMDFEKEFPKGEWDVAVALEVIEHVANTDFFVKNIYDALPKGGLLVFSVPHMVVNDDHKVLFDEEGIKKLITKYFDLKEFYIQDKEVISGKPATSPPKGYVGVAKKV